MFKYIYNFINSILNKNKILDSTFLIFIISGIVLFSKSILEFLQFLFLKKVFDFHHINISFLQYQSNFFENIVYYALFVILFLGLYFIKRQINLLVEKEIFKEMNKPLYYSSLLNIIIALPVIIIGFYGIVLLFKDFFPTLSNLPYLNIYPTLILSSIILVFIGIIFLFQFYYLRKTNSKYTHKIKKLIFFIGKLHLLVFMYNFVKILFNFICLCIIMAACLPLINQIIILPYDYVISSSIIFFYINFLLNFMMWTYRLDDFLNISIVSKSKDNILFSDTLSKKIETLLKVENIKIIRVTKSKKINSNFQFEKNYTISSAKILYKSNDIAFHKKIKFSVYFKKSSKNNAPSPKKLKRILSIIGIITIFTIAGTLFAINGYQHGYLKIDYQNKKYLIISHYNDFFITQEYKLDSSNNYLISTKYKLINKYDQNIQFLQTIIIPQNQFKIRLKSIDNITNVSKIASSIKEK